MERSRRERENIHRPQIFVNVEFGVSWSPNHAPRPHGLSYRSRAMRERTSNFPRLVAPPNTNYLALPSTYSQYQNPPAQNQYQSQQPQHQHQHQHQSQPQPQPQSQYHQPQQQSRHQHQPQQERPRPQQQQSRERQHQARPRHLEFLQQPELFQESRRSSRSSKSSHERGRSAPPPLSENNWDVSSPLPLAGSSTAQATASRAQPGVWKDLPEVPSRFRLGEDGMPWSAWSWPFDYDPNDDLTDHGGGSLHSHSREADRATAAAASRGPEAADEASFLNSPTVVDIQSPLEAPRYRQEDPERVRELEALGQAMMTIDNGFEDQWWNQGERHAVPVTSSDAGDLITSHPHQTPPQAAAAAAAAGQEWSPAAALGWTPVHSGAADERLAFSTANNLVSPITAYDSPPPVYNRLNRTLSTRSDELWFTGERYA